MIWHINELLDLVNVVIFNRAFMKNQLKIGRMINLTGKYDDKRNQFTASDINFEMINGSKIYPVYHLINGLKNKTLTNIIREAINSNITLEDYIPDYLVLKYNFLDKYKASLIIHDPNDYNDLKKAKLRTIYEELFIFMFKMNYLKYKYTLDNVGI